MFNYYSFSGNLAAYGLILKNMVQPEATDGNVNRRRKDSLYLPVN
jgi:hypothetical protein